MGTVGNAHYNEQIKHLYRLLKALPESIPVGKEHDFDDWVPDATALAAAGCVKFVFSQALEASFGPRLTSDGEALPIVFKSRGPALESVTFVLRGFINGNAGANLLLTSWVDDLLTAATNAIEAADLRLPRPQKTTAAKRLFEEEALEENAAKKKQKLDEKTEKQAQKVRAAAAKKITEQGAINWAFADLEDDPLPPPPTGTSAGRGAPKHTLLDKLVRHAIARRPRRLCGNRILPHSTECRYLPTVLRDEALASNAGKSLGAHVVGMADGKPDPFARFKTAGTQNDVDKKQARKDKTNYLTMNILCDGALVNNPSFRELVNHLDPTNGIAVASSFSSIFIPAEAARVTVLATKELKTQYNLSLGYDGGTTRGKQSIYTFHVTTPDREVYLMKGDEASGFSHTGEHIRTQILEVMDTIGRSHFASINCDSTGNTKLGRELGQASVPTVLIVPDPNHHLHNTVKGLCKIDYFQDAIGKMRMTISYFSHSTYSATHLKALRVILDINKGLETIGKTRFATFSDKHLGTIARAIKCLEGLVVTVGDIYKFYVAITAVLHDLFTEDALSISQDVRDEVSAIVNTRYDEMIGGPSGDLCLSGFFLDPEHVKSPLLFRSTGNQLIRPTPLTTSAAGSSGMTDRDLRDSMPSYTKVGALVLAKEGQASRDAPEFRFHSDASAIMDAFKAQFELYSRQHPPFSVRASHLTKPLAYWRSLAELPASSVLAFVAVKIFSILANSMPEERTVSRFTRIDTPDRSSHGVRSVVDQTKVYQHNGRVRRAAGDLPKRPSKGPTLHWRSVKTLFSSPKSSDVIDAAAGADGETPTPGFAVTPECEAGLSALNDAEPDDDDVLAIEDASKSLHTRRDGIDITLPFFRDLLADTPVAGAETIRSLSDWSAKATDNGGKTSRRVIWDNEAAKMSF
ncbi:ribonuclease H-like domain-containing protein [Mycena polygramma]|nr:ribonuclease H-like domain-containing protein [Mycena polygramma]